MKTQLLEVIKPITFPLKIKRVQKTLVEALDELAKATEERAIKLLELLSD